MNKSTQLSNANVYINGANWAGVTGEVQVPEVMVNMVERTALGMIGQIELPTSFQKMEGKMTIISPQADAWAFAARVFESSQIQLRYNLEVYDSTGRTQQLPVVIFMTATSKKIPSITAKQNEDSKLELDLNITALKYVVDGADVIEYDPIAGIYKVNGVDQMAQFRANTGI